MSDTIYNKIVVNGINAIDLTSDTVQASDVRLGKTVHINSGMIVTGTYVKQKPTFYTPTINISNDILTVTDQNGAWPTYQLLSNGVVVATFSLTKNYDLSTLSAGDYYLTVKAQHIDFNESQPSNMIQYTKEEPVVTGANLSNQYLKMINDVDNEIIQNATTLRFTSESSYITGATEICNVDTENAGTIKAYKNDTNLIIYSNGTINGFNCSYDEETEGLITITAYTVQEESIRLFQLTTINFDNFNTSNVTSMTSMFWDCNALTSLNLSSFNTSNVTDMKNMFRSTALTSLNLSNFDTSNVTDMSFMFSGCSDLTTLNISSFNTSNVTNMRNMFAECSNLTTLNISSFNTSNVTNMYGMFENCYSIQTLDVSSFDINNVTDTMGMFYTCRNLTNIYVSTNNSDWTNKSVTSSVNMFDGSSLLPNYDASTVDISKAKLSTNGGYFTLKTE